MHILICMTVLVASRASMDTSDAESARATLAKYIKF